MHIEYEVRVLNIDKEMIIKKLENLNASKVGEYNYKRKVYNFIPADPNKWIRVRTNGDKTTLTIKKVESHNIDGTKEMEIVVSDFEETNNILEELGFKSHTYQENKRIRYELNNVEIDIDTWPYIPSYLEIEGKNENDVLDMIKLLDLKENIVTSIDVQEVFKKFYNINIAKVPIVKFDEKLDEKYYIKKGK